MMITVGYYQNSRWSKICKHIVRQRAVHSPLAMYTTTVMVPLRPSVRGQVFVANAMVIIIMYDSHFSTY